MPSLCYFNGHQLTKSFTITNKFFFPKMEKEKFSSFIVISKLKFKFSFEIREHRF